MLRYGLRRIQRSKASAALLALIVALPVAFTLAIGLAAGYAVDLAGKAWTYEVGNIVLSFQGFIENNLTELLHGLPVARAKQLLVADTVARVNGSLATVMLVYNPSPSPPFSYTPKTRPGNGEAYVYSPGSRMEAPVGALVQLPGGVRLRVAGRVQGVVSVGSADLVLIVNRGVVKAVASQAGCRTLLSVVAAPGVDPHQLATAVEERLRSAGLSPTRLAVLTENDNPSKGPLESVSRALMELSVAGIAASLLALAGSGLISAERLVREAGVIEALGATRLQVALYFSAPGVAEAVAGVLTGIVLSLPFSSLLVSIGARGEVARLLMEAYPYHPSLVSAAARAVPLLVAALVLPVLPVALYLRGEPWERLRLASTPVRPPRLTSARLVEVLLPFKWLAARPWRLALLALLVAVLWGSTSSVFMLLHGYDSVALRLSHAGFDALVYSPLPPSKLGQAFTSGGLVEEVDTYLVAWTGTSFQGTGVVVYERTDNGTYLFFPVVEGRPPQRAGEAVVSERLAYEYGLRVGDLISLGGLCAAEVRVVGIAPLPANNGAAVIVGPGTCSLPGSEAMAAVRLRRGVTVSELRSRLLEDGVPAIVVSKNGFLDRFMKGRYALSFMLDIAVAGTFLASLLSVALFVAADTASRLPEIAVMRAIGYTDRRIAAVASLSVLYAAAAAVPAALAIGLVYSRRLSGMLTKAFGYIPPSKPLLSLAQASASIPVAIAAVTIALLILLRRTETLDILSRQP